MHSSTNTNQATLRRNHSTPTIQRANAAQRKANHQTQNSSDDSDASSKEGQRELIRELQKPENQHDHTEDAETHRHMRWFFLIFVIVWLLAAMVLPLVAYCLIRSPYCFSLFGTFAPPLYILYRITKYLFPMNVRDFQIKALKIQHKAEKPHNKLQ